MPLILSNYLDKNIALVSLSLVGPTVVLVLEISNLESEIAYLRLLMSFFYFVLKHFNEA